MRDEDCHNGPELEKAYLSFIGGTTKSGYISVMTAARTDVRSLIGRQ